MPNPTGADGQGNAAGPTTNGFTGRYLVLFRQDAAEAGLRSLREAAGAQIASTADVEAGAVPADQLASGEPIYFDKLGVAVVPSNTPQQMQAAGILATEDSGILAIEPEREVHVFEAPALARTIAALDGSGSSVSVPYLQGYRKAVDDLVDTVLASAFGSASAPMAVATAFDESVLTWGLQVTGVAASRYTGKGIRLCILDTGYTATHPDFVGRNIVSHSFITGEDVKADGHGHGTHVLGTAAGRRVPQQLPRYGVAYEADPFVGKVLSNAGSGNDAGILAGINWALTNQCQIISMSLGATLQPGQTYSRVYEAVAHRALAAGAIIIAAAGNDSQRPGLIRAVGHPANCPSILAVGALDQALTVSFFSNGGLNPQGGQVDIVAPGRNVISS
jgi:subtilisin